MTGVQTCALPIYYVQCGINKNYSEWSVASEPIPVSSFGTSSPSAGATFRGNQSPAVSSKSNVLQILGVDPRIYETVRVAALLNQGGAMQAFVIGEYSTDDFDKFYITHTGNEAYTQEYDKNSLPPVQDVYLRSKNLQIKKNRLNIADVTVQTDEDLSAMFSGVTLGQTRKELEEIGRAHV